MSELSGGGAAPVESLDLMRSAALDAVERARSVAWQFDLSTFHGPLTETLVWVTALADRLGRLQEPEYSGLAYARNCALHGAAVAAFVAVQEPAEPSPLLGDAARRVYLGPAHIWGFTSDPDPRGAKTPQRRLDYNAVVANHAVFPMLVNRLWHLGVNIWVMSDDLAPKRPLRQVTIEPGALGT